MTYRPPSRDRGALTLVVILLLAGVTIPAGAARDETYPFLRLFNEVLLLVRNNYVEETDTQGLMEGAYDGLLASLDPASEYLTREQHQRITGDEAAEQGDIGVDLSRRGGYLYVVSALPGSPAAKAGLRTGTRLRRIEGRSTREMTLTEALLALRGPLGSEVAVQRFPDRDGTPEHLTLKRARCVAAQPAARPVDGVPVLRITALPPGTAAIARRALRALNLRGEDLLLVDLRGASSGDYAEAARLAGLFAPPGEAGRLRNRAGEETLLRMEGGDRAGAGRFAVLIDAGTAGPAELIAQVLRQRGGATLIGTQTNGRATVQNYFPLGDGGVLRLSVARCVGPDGSSWDGAGLAPDRELKWESIDVAEGASEDDAAVRKALEILRSPAAPATPSAA